MIGYSRLGAKRWISLGGVANLQVSELVKLIIIIVLARFFSEVRTDRLTLADLVKVAILTGVPVGPDPEAAGFGYGDGVGSGRGGRRVSGGNSMEAPAVGVILIGAMMIPVGWHIELT